jgi:hypothetical protein
MATNNNNRHAIKITKSANEHLDEIIRTMKESGQAGASKTRLVSGWIMVQRIPGFKPHENRLSVAVDYCPQCAKIVPYHNGACHDCGAKLLHLLAVESEELMKLMNTANVINLRKVQ